MEGIKRIYWYQMFTSDLNVVKISYVCLARIDAPIHNQLKKSENHHCDETRMRAHGSYFRHW